VLLFAAGCASGQRPAPERELKPEKVHPFGVACVAACPDEQGQARVDCLSLCLLDLPEGSWRRYTAAEACSSTCTGEDVLTCERACCDTAGLDPWCCVHDVSCTDTAGKPVHTEEKR
jgi:hypothetical protein